MQRLIQIKIKSIVYLFCLIFFSPILIFSQPQSAKQQSISGFQLTAEEKEWVKSHSVIKVGVDPKFAPYEYVDASGQHKGMSADYLALLSNTLGIKFEVVPGLSWEEVMKCSEEKTIDVIAAVTKTPQRERFLKFTQVYMKQPTAIVTCQSEQSITNLASLSKQKVALVKDYVYSELTLQYQPDVIPLYTENVLQGLKLVLNGDAKALVCGFPTIAYEIRENNIIGLRVSAFSGFETEGLSIGVRDDWETFVKILDKALNAVDPEEHTKIRQRWLGTEIAAYTPSFELSPEEKKWIKSNPVITITSYSEGAPYGFSDSNGEYSGVIPDIAKKIEEKTGTKIQFVSVGYSKLIEHVENGSAEVTTMNDPYDMPYDKRYLKTREFLFLPYSLFVKKNSDLIITNQQNIKDKTIVLCRGWDLKNPALIPLKGNRFVFGESMLDCLNMVMSGEADGFYDVHSEINYILDKHSIKNIQVFRVFKEGYPVSFYVNKDKSVLHGILEKALSSIPRDEFNNLRIKWNTYIDDTILNFKYFELTENEKNWLINHRVLKVAVDPSWAPIESRNESGNYSGIAPDYLAILSEMLNVKFEYVNASWVELLRMGKEGKIDVFSSLTQTTEKTKYLSFTSPYVSFPVGIITRDDLPYVGNLRELRGHPIAVCKGYAVEEWLRTNHPELNLIGVNTISDGLSLLKEAKVDAFIDNMISCIYYIRQLKYLDLKIAGDSPYTYENCMAVPKDREILASIIDKALKAIPTDRRESIYNKWVSVRYEQHFNYSLLWKVLLAVFIIFSFFIYWNRKLANEVSKRTRALEIKTQELQASGEQLQTLVDASPIAMGWIDIQGNTKYANKKFTELTGYKIEDIATLAIWRETVYPDPEYRKIISPIWDAAVETAIQRGCDIAPVESPIVCKDGSVRIIETSGAILPDKILVAMNDLTERKLAEKALKESEERFRTVLEQAGDALYLCDLNGNLLDVNNQSCENLQYSREELMALHVTDIDPNFKNILQRPGFWATLETEASVLIESRHHRKDGSCFPVEIRVCQIELGEKKIILGLARDISQRKADEEALREREETLKAFVETSQDWIWAINLQGEHTYSNPAVEKILGYAPEDLIGKSCLALMHEEEQAMIKSQISICVSSKIGWRNIHIRWKHKNGGWRTLESSAVPILDAEGNVTGFRGVDRDITERKRMETQLQQSQKMEAIGTLAGGIAHDFNNILSAILGYSELAFEDAGENNPAKESVAEVIKAGRRAKDLVMQILAFSRQKEREMRPIRLSPIVKEAAKLLRATIPSTIEIQTSIESESPAVLADATQIHQVIMNLCTNAYYAMRDSGGMLDINLEHKKISVEEAQNHVDLRYGDYVVLSVSDTGCGMTKETIEHVFEPYFTTKEKGEGTGFGLAVVHSIVKDHKGAISVYSEPDKGSVFHVYLPVIDIPASEENLSQKTERPFGSEKVMFVDDESANCAVVQKGLERLGYFVTPYINPFSALSDFRKNTAGFDIIVTDLTMPKMTGLELAQQIHDIRPDIPMILCSGFSKTYHEMKGKQIGIKEFIDKPINIDQLGWTIRKIIDASKEK